MRSFQIIKVVNVIPLGKQHSPSSEQNLNKLNCALYLVWLYWSSGSGKTVVLEKIYDRSILGKISSGEPNTPKRL